MIYTFFLDGSYMGVCTAVVLNHGWVLLPRGHVAMPADTFDCHPPGGDATGI